MTDTLINLAIAQLWQLTALVLLVGMINQLLASRLPRLASSLWLVVAIKAITPPLWSAQCGLFSWMQASAVDYSPSHASSGLVDLAPAGGMASGVATTLLVVWLAGVLALALLLAARLVVLERLLTRDSLSADDPLAVQTRDLARRHGLASPDRIVVSSDELGPAIAGVWRTTLILPRSLVASGDRPALRPVILHELVHTTRRDARHALLMAVVRVLWWFHPAVWWATRKADDLVERCVDLTVTRDLRTGLADYARGLLKVLELRAKLQATPSLSGLRPCQITTERLQYLRDRDRADSRRRNPGRGVIDRLCRWSIAGVLLALTLPALPLDVLRPSCDPPADARPHFAAELDATTGAGLSTTSAG